MGQRARLAIYPSTPSLRLPVPLSPSILPCVRRYFAEPLSRRSALTIKSECLPAGDQTVTGIVVTVAFHPSIRRGEASALTARSPLLFSARREMADQATCLPTKSAVLLPMHQGDILGPAPRQVTIGQALRGGATVGACGTVECHSPSRLFPRLNAHGQVLPISPNSETNCKLVHWWCLQPMIRKR